MAALLALIPFKDWVYLAIIAALLLGGWYEYEHLQELGRQQQHAADIAAEAKAADAAVKQAAADSTDYQAKLEAVQNGYNAQIAQANATSDSLTDRLRAYEANRGTCKVLPGPAPAPAAGTAGAGSAGTAGQGSAVDADIDALIKAAAHDNAVIQAERAERDALTGK